MRLGVHYNDMGIIRVSFRAVHGMSPMRGPYDLITARKWMTTFCFLPDQAGTVIELNKLALSEATGKGKAAINQPLSFEVEPGEPLLEARMEQTLSKMFGVTEPQQCLATIAYLLASLARTIGYTD